MVGSEGGRKKAVWADNSKSLHGNRSLEVLIRKANIKIEDDAQSDAFSIDLSDPNNTGGDPIGGEPQESSVLALSFDKDGPYAIAFAAV